MTTNGSAAPTNQQMTEDDARAQVVAQYMADKGVTSTLQPALFRELGYIARGYTAKDSACADGVSHESIRGRRKKLYVALQVDGAQQVMQELLAVTLRKIVGR